MARSLTMGLGVAGLLLGAVSGFVVSRTIEGNGSAVTALADALRREGTIGPSAWPLAITAGSSILAAVLLPLTVVMALGLAERRKDGEIEAGGGRGRRRCKASHRRSRRLRDARSDRTLERVASDPCRDSHSRLRLPVSRVEDHS